MVPKELIPDCETFVIAPEDVAFLLFPLLSNQVEPEND
jgi:hypothetical protein